MLKLEEQKRAPVLDPVHRVSEIIFGLIMALTFTGALSAATAAREEIRTMMFAALGCNLAWGLVDAVMYLVQTLTERTRNFTLRRRVRSAARPQEATRSLRKPCRAPRYPSSVPRVWRTCASDSPRCPSHPPAAPGLDDYVGAVGVFSSRRPHDLSGVVPFMLFQQTALAMRVSNAVAVVTLSWPAIRSGAIPAESPGDPGSSWSRLEWSWWFLRLRSRDERASEVASAALVVARSCRCWPALRRTAWMHHRRLRPRKHLAGPFATGRYYFPPDQDNFLLVIGTADRGSLHLEARYNTRRWTPARCSPAGRFSGAQADFRADANTGRGVRCHAGYAPGFEASLAYGIADFYIEAEYLHDFVNHDDS